MEGQSIGRYQILRKIGAGGMGEVWLARDTELDRQIAIKFLPEAFSRDPQALERFRREARAAAALDHPNIITVHEIGEHEGRAFMVMAYVEGQPLSSAIRSGNLSVERALDITLQICDGLHKAHQAGIVHRDVKPDNIALDADGHVRILDFGLAWQDDATRLTQEHSTVGTLHYMSPEQARGGEVDARTDLFSVGAILYEMVTSRRAFDGEHVAAIHKAIAEEEPQPMARFSKEVTPELERIVRKLLAKDPKQRYQTATGVMADLSTLRVTSDTTMAAVSPTPARRRPLAWVGIVAVLAIAAAFLLPSPFRPAPPPVSEGRPMIVVLPFENLGAVDDEYFADGMTEEIISHLAAMGDLGVISRASAMRYKNSELPLDVIAAELGVDYVLDGTIRWDRSSGENVVRITPQLVRVADDTGVWSESYDRTLDRIFEVQADIAGHIAEGMQITLLDRERERIEAVPTENAEAYTYFLRGRDVMNRGSGMTTGRVERGIELLRRAVELDPGFADAWALLGTMHANYYHNGQDRTPTRLEQARSAVERAIELDPSSPEANLGMGLYHYWGLKNYQTALEWVERAQALRPGHMETIQTTAWILRRLGRYEEAIDRLRESLALSPQDMGTMIGLVECNIYLREHDEVERWASRLFDLYSDDDLVLVYREITLLSQGRRERDPAVLERLEHPDSPLEAGIAYQHWLAQRDYARALAAIESPGFEGRMDEGVFYPKELLRGHALLFSEDEAGAGESYRAAVVILEDELRKRPDDHRVHGALGVAHAGLGDAGAAVEFGRRSVELYPLSKDRYGGVWRLEELARIHALLGQTSEAVELLDQLLGMPSLVSMGLLQARPEYDGIRDDPAFIEMIGRHSPGS